MPEKSADQLPEPSAVTFRLPLPCTQTSTLEPAFARPNTVSAVTSTPSTNRSSTVWVLIVVPSETVTTCPRCRSNTSHRLKLKLPLVSAFCELEYTTSPPSAMVSVMVAPGVHRQPSH